MQFSYRFTGSDGYLFQIGYIYVDHEFQIIVWFRVIVDEKTRHGWTERVAEIDSGTVHRVPRVVRTIRIFTQS